MTNKGEEKIKERIAEAFRDKFGSKGVGGIYFPLLHADDVLDFFIPRLESSIQQAREEERKRIIDFIVDTRREYGEVGTYYGPVKSTLDYIQKKLLSQK